jgi:tryptophanyl-tRNA synthetase
MENNIVFSGIQPTGEMHIGNYFGAVANYVRLQNVGQYQTIYCVVDLHAMTTPYDPSALRRNSEQMFIDLLACGLDTDRSIVFVQSMVPEHTELAWIFSCVCSYGDLTRQTQFKEKSEQLEGKQDAFISAGLFTYPVLQAADILLYRAANVPVGQDQKQHLELSRTIANRFNNQFGEYFPEPQMLATETPKLLALNDPTKKMSKSVCSSPRLTKARPAPAVSSSTKPARRAPWPSRSTSKSTPSQAGWSMIRWRYGRAPSKSSPRPSRAPTCAPLKSQRSASPTNARRP